MDWRRTFLLYAALALAIEYALSAVARQLPPQVMAFLASTTLNYVTQWLVHSGGAWLISPPQRRGWWVLRYGAGVTILGPLIWLGSLLLVMVLPGQTELLLHPPEVVLVILFVLFLWPIWLVTVRRHINS